MGLAPVWCLEKATENPPWLLTPPFSTTSAFSTTPAFQHCNLYVAGLTTTPAFQTTPACRCLFQAIARHPIGSPLRPMAAKARLDRWPSARPASSLSLRPPARSPPPVPRSALIA
eukprot:scaffold79114_cov39-Phaeocystis_antarctica.AAC.2